MGCLFCKIVAREIPSQIVLETDRAVAFRDLRPVAPTHILVIPKKHIVGIAEATDDEAPILGEVLLAAREAAKKEGLTGGYRLVINSGPDAGQSVLHLHVHVLGGRSLAWPPG
jgi:histidine triad (HIT) family protein